jgi:hypothetical protein
MPAIDKVDDEADCKPQEESYPIFERQACHQDETAKYGKYWEKGNEGNAEAAGTIRLRFAKDQYCDGNEQECEERADVR